MAIPGLGAADALVSIKTSDGKFLVLSMSGHDHLGHMFEYVVELAGELNMLGSPKDVDLQGLLGTRATVTLNVSDDARYFDGYVTRMARVPSSPCKSTSFGLPSMLSSPASSTTYSNMCPRWSWPLMLRTRNLPSLVLIETSASAAPSPGIAMTLPPLDSLYSNAYVKSSSATPRRTALSSPPSDVRVRYSIETFGSTVLVRIESMMRPPDSALLQRLTMSLTASSLYSNGIL